jgi:hypothetical protein
MHQLLSLGVVLVCATSAAPLFASTCEGVTALNCLTPEGSLQLCVYDGVVSFNLDSKYSERVDVSTSIRDALLVPWIGFGKDVSVLLFVQGETRYRLYSSSTYDPQTDGTRLEAGVIVELPPTSMDAHPMKFLPCNIPQKADWFNILYDAKTATGQCWDRASESWRYECG